MNDNMDPSLRATFVDLMLEEELGAAKPPRNLGDVVFANRRVEAQSGPSPSRRRWTTAALVVIGSAVVLGVAADRGDDRAPAVPEASPQGPAPAQDRRAASAFFPLSVGHRWSYRERTGRRARTITVEATAEVVVDGVRVVELTELGDGDIHFSYWSATADGLRRHPKGGRVPSIDKPHESPLEVPSPIRAQRVWQFTRPGERNEEAGGEHRLIATVAAVDEELALGDRTVRATRIEVRRIGVDDELYEELWLSRGIGVVRRVLHAQGGIERTLLEFAPAEPAPDRQAALAAALGDRANHAAWIHFPANRDGAWTIRSSFAAVRDGDTVSFYRVLAGAVVAFAIDALPDYARMAKQEDYAARMVGVFPHRLTLGILELRGRLQAAAVGATEGRVGENSVTVNAGSTEGELWMTVKPKSGDTKSLRVTLTTAKGVPTSLSCK